MLVRDVGYQQRRRQQLEAEIAMLSVDGDFDPQCIPLKLPGADPDIVDERIVPFEVMLEIFGFFPSRTLQTICRVCRGWNVMSSVNQIWERHYVEEFGLIHLVGPHYEPRRHHNGYVDDSWKHLYLLELESRARWQFNDPSVVVANSALTEAEARNPGTRQSRRDQQRVPFFQGGFFVGGFAQEVPRQRTSPIGLVGISERCGDEGQFVFVVSVAAQTALLHDAKTMNVLVDMSQATGGFQVNYGRSGGRAGEQRIPKVYFFQIPKSEKREGVVDEHPSTVVFLVNGSTPVRFVAAVEIGPPEGPYYAKEVCWSHPPGVQRHPDHIRNIHLSPDGRHFALVAQDAIFIYDILHTSYAQPLEDEEELPEDQILFRLRRRYGSWAVRTLDGVPLYILHSVAIWDEEREDQEEELEDGSVRLYFVSAGAGAGAVVRETELYGVEFGPSQLGDDQIPSVAPTVFLHTTLTAIAQSFRRSQQAAVGVSAIMGTRPHEMKVSADGRRLLLLFQKGISQVDVSGRVIEYVEFAQGSVSRQQQQTPFFVGALVDYAKALTLQDSFSGTYGDRPYALGPQGPQVRSFSDLMSADILLWEPGRFIITSDGSYVSIFQPASGRVLRNHQYQTGGEMTASCATSSWLVTGTMAGVVLCHFFGARELMPGQIEETPLLWSPAVEGVIPFEEMDEKEMLRLAIAMSLKEEKSE